MSSVKKGSVLDEFHPFLVVPLVIERIDLPEKLPQAAKIQKFSFQNDAWLMVRGDAGAHDDVTRKEFVDRALRKGTTAGYTVALSLATAISKFELCKLWREDDKEKPIAPITYGEEELVTEAWTFVQATLNWKSWQALYTLIRRSACFTSVPHPLNLYASQILPQLTPSSLQIVYSLLNAELKLPSTIAEENRILCLKQAIQDQCPPVPVVFLPYNPFDRTTATIPLRHSCLPTVGWDWNPESHALRILALYALDEAEERRFSLVDGTTLEERQAAHKEKMSKACDCVRCCCERNPETLPTGSNEKTNVIRLGHLYFQEERFDDALRCYRHAVELDSSLADIWHAIGAVLLTQNKFREAQRHWRDAANKHPSLIEHEGVSLQLAKQDAYGYLSEKEYTVPVARQLPKYSSRFNGLCYDTDEPALSEIDCKQVIEWAESNKNWTTSRHYAVPTNDVPVHSIPQLLSWFNQWMDSVVRPLFSKQFDVTPANIFVHDAFVVRYEAARTNNFLPVHVDESTHSFVLVLNGDFEGGGTYFCDHYTTLAPKTPGCLVSFRGDSLRHGGNVVTKGTRYIMAVFLYHDPPPSRKRPLVPSDDSASSFTFGFAL
jgi:tetratricopeptide (TPR) repeat protein